LSATNGVGTAATTGQSVVVHASAIQITKIYYDSPGSDSGSNTSLNAEYVQIKNMSTSARSLTGWTLRDRSNHVYTLGTFALGAGKTVTVRTGKGTNTSTTRYQGRSYYVWNNDTDTAYLRNPTSTLIDSCSYNSTRYDYKIC
jgi:hypothetical protein